MQLDTIQLTFKADPASIPKPLLLPYSTIFKEGHDTYKNIPVSLATYPYVVDLQS